MAIWRGEPCTTATGPDQPILRTSTSIGVGIDVGDNDPMCEPLESETIRSGFDYFSVGRLAVTTTSPYEPHMKNLMIHRIGHLRSALFISALVVALACPGPAMALEPAAERIVVLTFDDSVASQATFVAPLLSRYGFGATFFITEGFEFAEDKEHYMTWQQIAALDAAGFEIGNHTRRHEAVTKQSPEQLGADVEYIEQQCAKNGIPRPISFCYPGYATSAAAVEVLRARGYRFGRAGGAKAFVPAVDEPLTLPQAFDGKPESTLEQFKTAVAQAGNGKIAVMTFHGVPDIKHPWVSTDQAKFESYMAHLKQDGCRVVALRDLERYLKPKMP